METLFSIIIGGMACVAPVPSKPCCPPPHPAPHVKHVHPPKHKCYRPVHRHPAPAQPRCHHGKRQAH